MRVKFIKEILSELPEDTFIVAAIYLPEDYDLPNDSDIWDRAAHLVSKREEYILSDYQDLIKDCVDQATKELGDSDE